jgi:peptidoglycan/LPS O-acetylase OafA/YrhL
MSRMPARYRAFGGLRFALALTVVLSHSWFLTFSEKNFIQDIGIGNFAVMGFFILSGFIISEAVDSFYANRAAAFTANRVLRLIPPYWMAAVVSIAAHCATYRYGTLKLIDYDTPPTDVMFSFDNMLIQITAIIPVFNFNKFLPQIEWYYFVRYAWAIFVEFVFYFSVAICMAVWPIMRSLMSLRAYLALCGIGALSIHIINECVRPLHESFRFVPYFVLGASLYWATVRRDKPALSVVALCYVLIAVQFTRYTQGQMPFYSDWWSGLSKPEVFVPTAIMLTMPFIVWWLSEVKLNSIGQRRDSYLGDLSYPLYLNHYAVTVVAYSFAPARAPSVQLIAIIASILLSWILQIIIERPMKAIRDKLRGGQLSEGSPATY